MNVRSALDISAYLVVGPENTAGRPVRDIVRAAVAGGFTCVQLRSKVASARKMIDLCGEAAEEIARLGRTGKTALLVDDRLDVVLAARERGIAVDGIHVGQSDIPVDVCRKFLGDDAIVGLSARTDELLDYVVQADVRDIDYFGAGPLHETPTKPDCGMDRTGHVVTRSLDEIAQLAKVSPRPVVVGGGVKLADIPALAATGVPGFFVVSAVAAADNPEATARQLADLWRKSCP